MDSGAATVLVIDDDAAIRESLRMALSYEGHRIITAANGAEGLDLVATHGATAQPIDAIVLDVMMPVVDGLSMCRQLRATGDRTPILVLTARTSVSDRVEGLDAGADDYLVKPFDLEELLARVRALLRRVRPGENRTEMTVRDLVLDPTGRSVTRDGEPIELTKTEFDLLHLLMSNVGVVLTREVIYERIWGFDLSATSRSLDVYVSYIRSKTEARGGDRIIETVRGAGFTIRAS